MNSYRRTTAGELKLGDRVLEFCPHTGDCLGYSTVRRIVPLGPVHHDTGVILLKRYVELTMESKTPESERLTLPVDTEVMCGC